MTSVYDQSHNQTVCETLSLTKNFGFVSRRAELPLNSIAVAQCCCGSLHSLLLAVCKAEHEMAYDTRKSKREFPLK